MELRFLGGAREVGRSAILVNDALLLDFGMLTANPPQLPVETPTPEAVVVSHARFVTGRDGHAPGSPTRSGDHHHQRDARKR